MQLEVVELVDDLLARLADEELGVLDDRRVDLLVAEAARDLAEVAEEPAPEAQVLGVEVARAARGLEQLGLATAGDYRLRAAPITGRGPAPSATPAPRAEEADAMRSPRPLLLRRRARRRASREAKRRRRRSRRRPRPQRRRRRGAPADLPQGLLLALSRFERRERQARCPRSELLVLRAQGRRVEGDARYEDPESNVFHKAMRLTPPARRRRSSRSAAPPRRVQALAARTRRARAGETLWAGGLRRQVQPHARRRDRRPRRRRPAASSRSRRTTRASWRCVRAERRRRLRRSPSSTARRTPSCTRSRSATSTATACSRSTRRRASRTSSTARRSPARSCATCRREGEGRTVVADLGDRHAKEILVARRRRRRARRALRLGRGRREGGAVEIRRYDAGTDPKAAR